MTESDSRREILDLTLRELTGEPVGEVLSKILNARTDVRDRDAVYKSVLSEIDGYGPIESFLQDPAVSEILVNSPEDIFYEREGRLHRAPEPFTSPVTFDRFVKRLLFTIDKAADRRHPFADGTLPDGSRVHVTMPPVSKGPAVSIRRHSHSHWSLEELRAKGMFTESQLDYFRNCLGERKNLLICGATGSGKTTLLRALLRELPENERLITVEDSDEIGVEPARGVALLTRPSPDRVAPPITLQDLVRNALRMRPDRLIVGEIRGEEAMTFLDAVSTGHGGSISSIHGSGASEALMRLEGLVSRAAPQWPVTSVRQLVFSAVDVVIHVTRKNGCRRVGEISELSGIENFGYLLDSKFA